MLENDISAIIVDSAIYVHRTLGPGLLESVYEVALAHVLTKRGLSVTRQQANKKQVLTYLPLSGLRLGLLLNFGAPTMKDGIRNRAARQQHAVNPERGDTAHPVGGARVGSTPIGDTAGLLAGVPVASVAWVCIVDEVVDAYSPTAARAFAEAASEATGAPVNPAAVHLWSTSTVQGGVHATFLIVG